MDLKQIQELIKLVKKSEINELKVQEGELTITIKNRGSENHTYFSAPATHSAPVVQPLTQTAEKTPAKAEAQNEAPKAEIAAENTFIFRSPMVGTFYRKPGADKDPFVKVGDSIEQGSVLCIIEAMKLFNEIEFDQPSGRIVKILAEDSSPVEYDQPLFLIEK
jgi:acetyl-CoA carboxylase biotin carboxyl carrier protein